MATVKGDSLPISTCFFATSKGPTPLPNAAPAFKSAKNFHIANETDFRFGEFIDTITEDVDGDDRQKNLLPRNPRALNT